MREQVIADLILIKQNKLYAALFPALLNNKTILMQQVIAVRMCGDFDVDEGALIFGVSQASCIARNYNCQFH